MTNKEKMEKLKSNTVQLIELNDRSDEFYKLYRVQRDILMEENEVLLMQIKEIEDERDKS